MQNNVILDRPALLEGLTELFNRCSTDAALNTPDYVLADFVINCLKAFEITKHSQTL